MRNDDPVAEFFYVDICPNVARYPDCSWDVITQLDDVIYNLPQPGVVRIETPVTLYTEFISQPYAGCVHQFSLKNAAGGDVPD